MNHDWRHEPNPHRRDKFEDPHQFVCARCKSQCTVGDATFQLICEAQEFCVNTFTEDQDDRPCKGAKKP